MRCLAGALVLLLGGATAGCGAADGEGTKRSGDPAPAHPAVASPARYAADLTRRATRVRAAEGLDELARSRCLARAATGRAEELLGGPLEHRPLPDIAHRCTDTGRLAENLVRSAATPGEVVAAWMGSTGHRNNLLDPAMLAVGTGCRRDGAELLCAQLYLQGE